MKILGVDPGLATIGYGIVDYKAQRFTTIAYGAITTRARLPIQRRLEIIADELDGLITTFSPQVMAVEELFFNTNITTGIAVAEARGVILLTAHRRGLQIAEYTPLQVKQAVSGYGRADKRQIITLVTEILGLKAPPKPDDAADALAIAVCHAHTSGSLLAKYYNSSNLS